MISVRDRSRLFRICILLVGLLGAGSVAVRSLTMIDPWQVSDYLIHWNHGLVRRGMPGTLLFLTPLSGQELVWAVVAIQVLLVFGLALGTFMLVRNVLPSSATTMLTFSPAFLMFPVLTPGEGARKELLGLIALIALLIQMNRQSRALWVAPALYAVAVFSHEANLVVLPALLYVLWRWSCLRPEQSRVLLWAATAFTTLALAGLVFTLRAQRDAGTVLRICDALVERNLSASYCAGAVDALQTTMPSAFAAVVARFPDYLNFAPLIALSLVPFAFINKNRGFWFVAGATFVFAVPLFLFAIDYGRWVFLVTAILSLVALGFHDELKCTDLRIPWPWVVAYLTLWSLPGGVDLEQDSILLRILSRSP